MFALLCQTVRHCKPRQLVACLTSRQVRKPSATRSECSWCLSRQNVQRGCAISSYCNRHDETVLSECFLYNSQRCSGLLHCTPKPPFLRLCLCTCRSFDTRSSSSSACSATKTVSCKAHRDSTLVISLLALRRLLVNKQNGHLSFVSGYKAVSPPATNCKKCHEPNTANPLFQDVRDGNNWSPVQHRSATCSYDTQV